jgi:hypothetical protein
VCYSLDVNHLVSEPSIKRYFTLAEANAQVPELRALFTGVLQLRGQLKTLYQHLDDLGFAPAGGDDVDDDEIPPDVVRNRAIFYGMAQALREQIEAILELGCVIKDIESGLVDWPAMHQEREIWLCWRYGEGAVEHWHELRSGFSGRRPVTELLATARAEH